MRRVVKALTGIVTLLVAAIAIVVSAPTATAASLVQVTNFGFNPTNLGMYLYMPTSVAARPAILVAVHQCTGSGPGFFGSTQFASLADQFGFIVVYPSATRAGSCFDVSTPQSLTHDGSSDPAGIVSMVDYGGRTVGVHAQRRHLHAVLTGAAGSSRGGPAQCGWRVIIRLTSLVTWAHGVPFALVESCTSTWRVPLAQCRSPMQLDVTDPPSR